MSLIDTLNSSSFDFYFLALDDFLDINLPELSNFISISPQKLNITLLEKNSGRLLAHPKTIDFINQHSRQTGRHPAIIPFKPSAKIDHLCQENNWTLIANHASLNRFLEDKLKFVDICKENGFPTVPSIVDFFTKDNYLKAVSQFGSPLVVQTHFGWAGNSSYLSRNFSDLNSLLSSETKVKFSPYLSGYSLINNCCLTDSGLIQSPPGLQYTGLPRLTKNPLATVGRQWPAMATPDIIDQVTKLTVDFSKYLKTIKFQGFFGLDFLVSQNKVYLLECNARLTASFAFYTEIEKKAGYCPLFYYHLGQFCHLPLGELQTDRFADPKLVGSEITLKDSSGTTIKKYHHFSVFCDNPKNITISTDVLSHVL